MILGVEGCRENDHIHQMNVSVYVIGIIVTAVSWNLCRVLENIATVPYNNCREIVTPYPVAHMEFSTRSKRRSLLLENKKWCKQRWWWTLCCK